MGTEDPPSVLWYRNKFLLCVPNSLWLPSWSVAFAFVLAALATDMCAGREGAERMNIQCLRGWLVESLTLQVHEEEVAWGK